MARAATTSDAFNAVAEPWRRDILNYLAMQERYVFEIVDAGGILALCIDKLRKFFTASGLGLFQKIEEK